MRYETDPVIASKENHTVLATIVATVRDHRKVCPVIDCCGELVPGIEQAPREQIETMLQLALVELARRPAPATLEER